MFTSLKSKIFILITMIMAMTAAAIMYSTHRDVGQAMLSTGVSSAQNVLQLVELKIRGSYNRLISGKIEILSRLKNELNHISVVSISVLDQFVELGESGRLSREEAQAKAIEWLATVDFDKGELFVFGRDATIIGHSDERIVGTSIANLKDLKGRSIAEVMRDDEISQEGDSAVLFWKKLPELPGAKKMGYFMPISEWEWTLGAVIDFADIEAESKDMMTNVIEDLRDSFSKIQIASSGYVFLFNSKNELLISPTEKAPGITKDAKNKATGNYLFDELIEKFSAGENVTRYVNPG